MVSATEQRRILQFGSINRPDMEEEKNQQTPDPKDLKEQTSLNEL
jgi:hypothetical protein